MNTWRVEWYGSLSWPAAYRRKTTTTLVTTEGTARRIEPGER